MKEDRIAKILSDTKKVTAAMQMGIKRALLDHKIAGNPVCGMKDGEIIWVQPEDINVSQADIHNCFDD